MPRNMSFMLTTEQVRNKTKTVTRRTRSKFLKTGDIIKACVKCMGLKKGEKVEVICHIELTDVRREHLSLIRLDPNGTEDEGFPEMTADEFIAMFCKNMGGDEHQIITRIEFKYI